ncbi:MAG TPA: pyridoxal phosphate-dependent aminotransferase [Spirochaetota bacterium]|nr:pyridoxal phosphate-dependent aminotransferase [Spirochaetota bacterium]HPJ38363.1 pyridoxal phosphate-dependent aminotransferase [Spirochaetota bacterium]
MQFSDRILQIKPSPTLAITAVANAMKAKGIDVIGFGSGEPDFDTPRSIKDAAIRAIESGKTKYTPVGGVPELKQAIAEKFRRDNNLEYSPGEITVNCGGKHSFYNLMQILLNEGDEVIVPAPYWVSYPSMISLAEGTPVILYTKEENGFKITPEELKKHITPKTRAIVINSPSNPTGATYSKQELTVIADILLEKNILVISDDIYESILYDGAEFTNIACLSEEHRKNTIVLNGVSKTYSMTGWRIGYMAGNADIIKKIEIIQSQSTSNPTSISQWASIEAITGDQSVIQEMVDAFTRRRQLIVDGLNSIPGISCMNPEGAFYAFPNVSGVYSLPGWKDVEAKYADKPNNSHRITTYLLEEAKVAVVPGAEFGSDDNVRMSFATSDENISKGLERIKEAVQKLL